MPLAITDFKQAEAEFIRMHDLLQEHIVKANAEAGTTGKMSTELKVTIENLSGKCIDMADRCLKMEQRIAELLANGIERKSTVFDLGDAFIKSEGFKSLQPFAGSDSTVQRGHRMDFKTAIINATGLNQPLVPADYQAPIIALPKRVLKMRDVMTVGGTDSNAIQFPRESAFTNNAGAQISGSPQAFENVVKPESAITFTLVTEPVCTIAHWIPASKQVLADAPMLKSYINGRLMYGLKLKEDTEILLGTGLNGRLNGLYTQRTAYSVPSPTVYTTKIDVIRDAIRQAENAEYMVNAIVMHTTDWAKIELAKDSTGRYLFSDPQNAGQPRLWGVPIVVTNSITAGTFLVGSFDMACQLWDREVATVEVGLNNDNFTRNMVTILCEERVCVTVFRPTALIGGAFLL